MKTFVVETADQRERLLMFIRARELPIQVEVGHVRVQRTSSQNARLWALHSLASKETGYSTEELHEEALCRFFGYTEKRMPTGWIKRVPLKRSSTREKKEFAEFMEATEAFYAAELGVWLGQEEMA